MAREAAAWGAAEAEGTSAGPASAAAAQGSRGAPAPVTWRRVWRAAQETAAHALLLCFIALLALKLDGLFARSWLITWWSIDEDSKEEQAHLCYTNNIGYSTFCSYPPEMVKEMPKKVLVKEVQRLQLALGEQTEMAKLSQQQCDRLKNERILCRICFERDICIVLLPCRHHVLCEPCSSKCRSCPICRVTIESKLSVYDAMSTADLLSDAV